MPPIFLLLRLRDYISLVVVVLTNLPVVMVAIFYAPNFALIRALVVKSKKVSEKNALLCEVHFWIENE